MLKIRKHLAIFLIIGMICSGILLQGRISAEKNYKNVDIVLDYEQVLNMAAESNEHDAEYFLKEFKKLGVTSVGIVETTLDSLAENVDVDIRLEGYDIIVDSKDQDIIQFVKNGYEKKLGKDSFEIVDEDTLKILGNRSDYIFDETYVKDNEGNTIGLKKIAQGTKKQFIGLGYLKSDIELIKKAGLEVVPRTLYNSEYEDEKSIDFYFDFIDENGIEPGIMLFAGKEILGGADNVERLANEMESRGIIPGMIENSVQREHLEQDGMEQLVQKMDYNATRVFNLWEYLQKRFDYQIPFHRSGQEVMNSIYRAVTERNIRVVYFKPFIDGKDRYVTDMEIYGARFAELEKRLSRHKISIAPVQPMNTSYPSRLMQMGVAAGIVAAGFVLLENMVRSREKLFAILFGIAAAGAAGIFASGIATDMAAKVFALLASIILPSVAMFAGLNMVKKILAAPDREKIRTKDIVVESAILLVIMSAISLVGAMFETSLLSHSKYLLEMDIFRGVKISQVGPIGITVLIWMAIFGYKRSQDRNTISKDEILRLLNENIKVWHVVLAGALGAFAIVYIARMGHETSIQPSSLEILSRNALEYVLKARPRTKAITVAHPAMLMLVYIAYRKKEWLVLPISLAVSIGQGNIVNTFSHIRTPLYMSLYRSIYEIAIGVLVGAVIVGIVNVIWNLIERRYKNA